MRRWASADSEGLRQRVQRLVTERHGGSENRAATAWRVRQSTLNRFLRGETSRPSVGFAQRIARHEKLTMDWLVDGKGTGPAIQVQAGEERAAWHRLVRRLALSAECERAVAILPSATNRAFIDLTLRGMSPRIDLHATPSPFPPGLAERAWQADRHAYLAWTELLGGLLAVYGKADLAAKLEAEWPLLALGYQAMALNLLAEGRFNRADLDASFERAALEGVFVTQGAGTPTIPPLEETRRTRTGREGETA